MTENVDCVVIGAGVVGLAVARALALQGREVLVLEAASAVGTGTSSRNSEVIHAGIYYEPGSLKARLCVQGRQLLYDYCASLGINHQYCGKLIVATQSDQVSKLHSIKGKAWRNGVTDLVLLTGKQAQAMEPQLTCEAALLSPSTGIVDSHGLMLALQADLENAGGIVALNSPIEHASCAPNDLELVACDGTLIKAKTVVNSSGLAAPVLARKFRGLDARHVPQAF